MRAAARQEENQYIDHLAVRRALDQRLQPFRELAVGDRVAGGDEGRARVHQENKGEHNGELQESPLAHSWATTAAVPKGVIKAAPEQLRHQSHGEKEVYRVIVRDLQRAGEILRDKHRWKRMKRSPTKIGPMEFSNLTETMMK